MQLTSEYKVFWTETDDEDGSVLVEGVSPAFQTPEAARILVDAFVAEGYLAVAKERLVSNWFVA